jgi:uncharacterized iron-regulated protein
MRIVSIVILATIFLSFSMDKPAYVIFTKDGSIVDYKTMLDTLKSADIIMFGEYHDNPISHWLQLEVTEEMFFHKQSKLVLGAEMFEADNQEGLTNYINDKIDAKKFSEEVRLWPNYKTDYSPLVELAKKNKLKFIATNIPRRYASMVFKGGLESLDELKKNEKEWIAPLPIPYEPELKCYKEMLNMGMHGKANENFPKAQAIKDATMAHFIMQNWEKGKLFIHYNGAYHSDNNEGIVWYLRKHNKDLNVITITTVTQAETNRLENENKYKADFIICVPETMTRTH